MLETVLSPSDVFDGDVARGAVGSDPKYHPFEVVACGTAGGFETLVTGGQLLPGSANASRYP